MMRDERWLLLLVALVAVYGAAGCASPVVGAECREGLTQCGSVCVDLDRDPAHCGACDNACALAQICTAGRCVGSLDDGGVPLDDGAPPDAPPMGDGGPDLQDGSVIDGGLMDGAVIDGGLTDGGVADGGPIDGGPPPGCALGELSCEGRCVRPDTDPENCGGCGLACEAGEFCSGGACDGLCAPPRSLCGEICVDTDSDPDHCGGCGVRCPAGVCLDGMCRGPLAGHVVFIGHDYRVGREGLNRVAGNAVFLARSDPVQVLVYEGGADVPSLRGVDRAIDQVAAATGRTWSRHIAHEQTLTYDLVEMDVLVIAAQRNGEAEALEDLGAEWALALEGFLRRGGVVVAFEGRGGPTHRVLIGAGLLEVAGRTVVSGAFVDVVAPADAVSLGVPLVYRAEETSVRLDGLVGGGAVVAEEGGPVVIHRATVR